MVVLGLGDQAHAAAPKQNVCDKVGIAFQQAVRKDGVVVAGEQLRRNGAVTECAFLITTKAGYGCYRIDVRGTTVVGNGAVGCAAPFRASSAKDRGPKA